MKKKLALLLAALMALGLFAACSGSTSSTPPASNPPASTGGDASVPDAATTQDTLVIHHLGDPLTLNPDTTGDDYAYAPAQNIFGRLVKLDANKTIVPDLARSWETSEDGLQITFHLAEGVKWHDGEPFTSADVKYTYETLATDENLVSHGLFAGITSVDTPDDNTAVFNLATADVSIIGYMGWYGCFILPEHLYNNGQAWADNPANEHPIGTGPYKFVSYSPGTSIELEANPDYWEGAPKINKLIFKIIPEVTTAVQALRTGEIDYMAAAPTTEALGLQDEGYQLALAIYPSPMYMVFNFREGHETPAAVREAVALCVNREDINAKVFTNVRVPEYNFYPSLIEWASNDAAAAPAQNIEEAIQVLEDAGYTKDADGYYVRGLQIECYTDDNAPDVCKLLSAYCKEAGIELIVNAQEYLAWDQTVNELSGSTGDFSMALMGGFQGPDPNSMSVRFGDAGAGSTNLGRWHNDEAETLYAEGRLNSDEAYRQERYFRVQEIMREELPIIPVISYAEYNAYAPNLHGTPDEMAGTAGWGEFTYAYFD